MTLADQGFLDLGDMRLEYRMIGPRPDVAPTLVLLHEGLGCVGIWGRFPDKLAAATGAGVFVYSRAGYGHSSPSQLPRPVSLHARGGARRAAARARRHRFPARAPGRPQRRRIDRRDLCRQHPGPSRARARADGAAFLHRGHGHRRDRARQGAFEQGNLRAKLARLHADPDNAFHSWCDPWLDPDSAMGLERRARPYPRADPDRAGRGRPIRHRAADRGGARRNAIARSRSRCCRIRATRRTARRRRRPCARSPSSPTGCCAITTKAISPQPSADCPSSVTVSRPESETSAADEPRTRWPTQTQIEQRQEPDRFPDRSVEISPLEARGRRRRRDAC